MKHAINSIILFVKNAQFIWKHNFAYVGLNASGVQCSQTGDEECCGEDDGCCGNCNCE